MGIFDIFGKNKKAEQAEGNDNRIFTPIQPRIDCAAGIV